MSEEEAAHVRAAAAARGIDLNTFAVAALVDAADADEVELDEETSAAVVAAGLAAIEDEKAGRLRTLDQVRETAEAAIRAVEERRKERASV